LCFCRAACGSVFQGGTPGPLLMLYGAVAALAAQFPPLEAARADGLLCMGGDLQPERLLAAYSRGIFPWYEEGLPVLWWSPDPRCVLPLGDFRLPRRSARALRRSPFALTLDRAFGRVIRACAAPRPGASGTWIIPAMIAAYERLHALGYAHSIEAWRDGELAGGLYGVALGRAFFGESMFHRAAEASRAALAGLVELLRQRGALLLDCQQETPHIMRMGGVLLPRAFFVARLREALGEAPTAAAAVDLPWTPWRTAYMHDPASGQWRAAV
jgi:leucyl/phenylalanyl-tRNA--protein transferase